jgi:hypothetical protein
LAVWTKTAFAKVPPLYGTENVPADKKVARVKIFGNLSDHRHYIIEYDHETGQAFVLTTNEDVCELGYLSLPELQEMNDNFRQEDPQRPGRRRFICPPWQRELHGTPRDGYNIADVKREHSKWWAA